MLSLIRLAPSWLPLAAAGVAAAAGFALAGVQTVRLAWEQTAHATTRTKHAAAIEEWRKDVDEANRRAHMAGEHYERWRAAQKPKIITRTVEVNRALETDHAWADDALPAGVRDSLERAAADTGAGQSHPAVPTLRPAPAGDAR